MLGAPLIGMGGWIKTLIFTNPVFVINQYLTH